MSQYEVLESMKKNRWYSSWEVIDFFDFKTANTVRVSLLKLSQSGFLIRRVNNKIIGKDSRGYHCFEYKRIK